MATEAVAGEPVPIEKVAPEPSTAATIAGEVVGSFMLATLGLGIGAAAFVYQGQGAVDDVVWFGDIWPTAFGWALTIALGIYCTASLSGAHFNPAVTLALAATGRHPWSQVPRYIVCQIVGWFLGAAVVVALFGSNMKKIADAQGIRYGDPGSESIGSVLTTYVPNPGVFGTGAAGRDLVPVATGFGAEIFGTAILLFVILSLLETRHANAPAAWFFPLIVGSTVGLLIMMLAGISQASFNPARDIGPRLMLLVMGFGDAAIPGPRDGAALAVTTIGPIIGALVGAFFHDKVMRPLIPGHDAELAPHGERIGLDWLAREQPQTSLLGHTPAMPIPLAGRNGAGVAGIELVMLDVGGTIYDDDCVAQALLRATRELAGSRFDEQTFWHLYDEGRQAQTTLRVPLGEHFGVDVKELGTLEQKYVEYPPSALYADVTPTLDLLATRYKLGVASQMDATTEALRRHGLLDYFAVVATPQAAGANKTDERFWKWALDQAGVPAGRAVNVGNRLDSDIRPAKKAGMRSIWLLRGEAPPSPTVEQLSEPDAVVTSFSGVPNALAGMADVRTPAGVQ